MWESHCRIRTSVTPLSDVNMTVGEYREKTLCSRAQECVSIFVDTLVYLLTPSEVVQETGGKVLAVSDWWVGATECSQLEYAIHGLRKGRVRPSSRNSSMPRGEVSTGDVASFCARPYVLSFNITLHWGAVCVKFHPWWL
jgi:hypothetical protein